MDQQNSDADADKKPEADGLTEADKAEIREAALWSFREGTYTAGLAMDLAMDLKRLKAAS